jgi:hypothetical protein
LAKKVKERYGDFTIQDPPASWFARPIDPDDWTSLDDINEAWWTQYMEKKDPKFCGNWEAYGGGTERDLPELCKSR